VKIASFFIASLLTFNVFACTDNFNGKFFDENSASNTLEIKVVDCSLHFELSLPAESRTGKVIADNVDRIIWNKGGRKISEQVFVTDDTLTIKIVDKHVFDTYYQTQIYKLTPTGIEFDIAIFNSKHSYDYKKHINYIRE
jgi:hypothetical protein